MLKCVVRVGATVLVLLASTACQTARTPVVYHKGDSFDAQAQRVVVVSFDGLRPDAIEAADTPHIHSVRDAGTYTESAWTVMPSITLVSHTSMLTGVTPAKHGITWNDWVPEYGIVKVPTIFELAHLNGKSTALVAGKPKFKHLERAGTVDHLEIEEGDPDDLAEAVVRVIHDSRPDMLFVHFRHADYQGHKNGWMSNEQLEAVIEADEGLGKILAALDALKLKQSTAVIVTADHGGHDKNHGTGETIDRMIPWIAVGAGIPTTGRLEKTVNTFDTAATAAKLLRLDVPAEWDWDGQSVF